MAGKDASTKHKYRYDLFVDGRTLGYFEEYEGPGSKTHKQGNRFFSLKMGLVTGDAVDELINWHRQVMEGKASLRAVEVVDSNSMNAVTFEGDRNLFFDASLVSMGFYKTSPSADRMMIDKMDFIFARHKFERS